MGMFDYFMVEDLSILPDLDDEDRQYIESGEYKRSGGDFQTKSFDRTMATIILGANGSLTEQGWRMVEDPDYVALTEADEPDEKKRNLRNVMQKYKREEAGRQAVKGAGCLSFYTVRPKDQWERKGTFIEYAAVYSEGKVVAMVKVG